MKVVKGNKTQEIPEKELVELLAKYISVEVDLGTGDGRYIYKNALANKNTLYIGIDPSESQLETYSKKALKSKLENTLFVVGSIELFPLELTGFADVLNILFPWGTLLQSCVDVNSNFLNATKVLKNNLCEINIIFGYDKTAEPTEYDRLNLGELSKDKLIKKYSDGGFKVVEITNPTKTDIKKIESTWGKKLAFGKDRPIFNIKLQPLR